MRDEEIKKIAQEVAKILKEERKFKMPGDSVNIGTAGKVFRNPLVNSQQNQKQKNDICEENTCGPNCKSCSPQGKFSASEVKQMGADRISFCNPGSDCSQFASMIDHTLLKANATQEEIGKLCQEARQYNFASVCVNPAYVSLASRLLKGSNVKVCTVIGFPLGSTTPTVKAIEARDAIAAGADEIDMVINIGALKSGNDQLVLEDIKAVREATRGKILKVIIETAYLTRDEKIRACKMSKEAGADFVKTSTGFGPHGATVEDVKLMREVVGPDMGVKASGGIRDSKTASEMVKAGATRLGTSASVAIVTGKDAGGGKY
ncbi:MAG TPA: deoxyribose-phosphate aldolase [Elusimicrobiales bacterium]|nr:deoxyribose-phosphate aldolase [Elusimicrobiales bacterium]HOL62509.1 deoxyribose-phosphate aldolase [Elusimicrobiales bacterium]HPO94563.1 deoxyribose-phosphate aldolase [Elusimicrobiales bacterium]